MSGMNLRGKRIYGRIQVAARANYDLHAAAALAGVRPELLRHYCRTGLLGRRRADASNPTFDDDALYEVRRIERLRTEYGLTRRALPLVCELWRRVERLQVEVRFLRRP
jgi:DNA-binding transcriptional MerR regulator